MGVIDAPASASARGYLARTLPSVYTEDEGPSLGPGGGREPQEPFVVRWLSGLEQVLDPAVTLIDNLAWHVDARTAPDDVVLALLYWLGFQAATELDPGIRRSLLRRAMAYGRMRGTLAGLRELLGHAFPEIRFEVTDTAQATQGDDPDARVPAPPPQLTVRCPAPLSARAESSLRRLVEESCPVHVRWTLEIGERGTPA
jgi:phage tail-like protein